MIAMKLCEFRCGDIAGIRPAPVGDYTIYECPVCGTYGIARGVEATFTGTGQLDIAVERQFLLLRPAYIKRRKDGTIGIFDLKKDGSGVQLEFVAAGAPV